MTTQMTRPLCRTIKADMLEALEAVAAKHGIAVNLNAGSYDSTSLGVKATFTIKGGGGIPVDFAKLSLKYGLSPDDYGKVLILRGDAHKITGFAPRSRKYPVLASRVRDGRIFKWTVSSIQSALLSA